MMLTFRNGSTESQTVMITILSDTVVESTESFNVSLTTSEPNVTASGTATVNIQDNSSKFWDTELFSFVLSAREQGTCNSEG